MPEKIARTIAQQAMGEKKKSINPRNVIYGLLAMYERDDPTMFEAIRELIKRKV